MNILLRILAVQSIRHPSTIRWRKWSIWIDCLRLRWCRVLRRRRHLMDRRRYCDGCCYWKRCLYRRTLVRIRRCWHRCVRDRSGAIRAVRVRSRRPPGVIRVRMIRPRDWDCGDYGRCWREWFDWNYYCVGGKIRTSSSGASIVGLL